MKTILMLSLILSLIGCVDRPYEEVRVVCDDFTSPWGEGVWFYENSGVITYRTYYTYGMYKMPVDTTCEKQKRKLQDY